MASRTPSLTVILDRGVTKEIRKIWRYDAEHRGVTQANRYEAFLKRKIHGLSTGYAMGKVVESDASLRYILMKPRGRGDGHVAVYLIDLGSIPSRIGATNCDDRDAVTDGRGRDVGVGLQNIV